MLRTNGTYSQTGVRKAAMLMVGIGSKTSSSIMKQLTEPEVEAITKELAQLRNVASDKVKAVSDEFRDLVMADKYMAAGGVEYAREILKDAIGSDKAFDIISKVKRSAEIHGFNLLKSIDPDQLLSFAQKEHPQTIAFILTQVEPDRAAHIVSSLSEELRNEVMYRFATMEMVSHDLVREVESVFEASIDSSVSKDRLGGIKATAEILNLVGQTVEKAISTDMAERNPELAEKIKNLMFVFEDLQGLDNRSLQKVLKEVNTKELAIALKVASDELKDKIFSNMSTRASEMVKDELEFMGPVRLSEVEATQQQIVDIVRKLAEADEIVLASPGRKEDVLV